MAKYKLIQKEVTAVQWKGWPHKIKGLKAHWKYPQLAACGSQEVYEGDWIITHKDGSKTRMDDWDFQETYTLK